MEWMVGRERRVRSIEVSVKGVRDAEGGEVARRRSMLSMARRCDGFRP